MLESALILLMNSLLLMLRITPGESFARPLSHEDEQKYLTLWAEGDIEARNKLVEHNMRLVSHIMKNILRRRMMLMISYPSARSG